MAGRALQGGVGQAVKGVCLNFVIVGRHWGIWRAVYQKAMKIPFTLIT